MEGAGNQPQNENPPSLFVGNIAPSTSISAASPLENNQDASTISQSGWTSSKATFRKYYLIPSLLFSVPGHITVLGVVTDSYELEWTGIDLWMASPIIAIIVLAIFLIIGISKKNKSILYAVLAGLITDTVIWFLSVYYYAHFKYGGW
jgi:energy-converting hydrogenase Eha subunit B